VIRNAKNSFIRKPAKTEQSTEYKLGLGSEKLEFTCKTDVKYKISIRLPSDRCAKCIKDGQQKETLSTLSKKETELFRSDL